MSDRWLAHTHAVLSAAGLKTSHGRTVVIEPVTNEDGLFSGHEVSDRLRALASPATSYRPLDALHGYGLVRHFDAGDGPARSKHIEPSGAHHHGVFDDGTAKPFADAELEHSPARLGARLGFHVTGHDVSLGARRHHFGTRRMQACAHNALPPEPSPGPAAASGLLPRRPPADGAAQAGAQWRRGCRRRAGHRRVHLSDRPGA